jgi:Ca2+:H+ antiporter
MLTISLAGVILLSKKFAQWLDLALGSMGAPPAVAGIVVALLVLSPESISALKAARDNVLQKSVNLALGSALATIGLTIPTVAAISLATGVTVILGLGQRETLLLALTLFVSAVTFAAERTNVLFGLVHLVIFACWLFLVFVP